jgi:hypothetical protein
MFPRLIDAGTREDIYVIWSKAGEIVGATVVALVPEGEKEGPMHESLAWPATLGTFSHLVPRPSLTIKDLDAG